MENINKTFSKYYKRIENDLKQINGITPLMLNIVSMNYRNLEDEIKRYIVEKGERDESGEKTI